MIDRGGYCYRGNYGAHAQWVQIGGLKIYYSYNTPIAFWGSHGLRIRYNSWGPTTGKHIKSISEWSCQRDRVDGRVFDQELEAEYKKAIIEEHQRVIRGIFHLKEAA